MISALSLSLTTYFSLLPLKDNKVYSYHKNKLDDGYPKDISEVFPGIPDHLDAAVECPKPECPEDTVVFFKGIIIASLLWNKSEYI